uniref:Uncharacterized protein n=1 Tax=Arundo donax TaxID=35708 RepID=A0A0A9EUI5_ARUDO
MSGAGFKFSNASAEIMASNSDTGKPAAAKLASTLILSALDATAALRPAFLHSMISSRAPGNPMPEFGFAYLSRYISKNRFLAFSGSKSFTPFTLATPPRKLASPVPMKGTKSSTVTSTPISAKTSTPAWREGSSLLQSTPSMSKSTAETFPQAVPSATSAPGEKGAVAEAAAATSRRPRRGTCMAAE